MLELVGVDRFYRSGPREIRALSAVDLRVEAGECLLVKGVSGSGKTTLLNLLAGLDRPTAGTIRFEGDDLGRLGDVAMSRVRNRKIGYVFQSFYLEPSRTALGNVILPLIFSGVPRSQRAARGREILERVGLGDRALERAGNLSAGQKQRVALARAVVNRPSLILADEPTANLDPVTGQEILDLLIRINREDGVTLILVSHEKDLEIEGARSIWFCDGEMTEGDPPPPAPFPGGKVPAR